jgi:hypothetical protein
MFIMTPSMLGALLAGAAFYALLWVAIHKLDEIPYLNDFITTKQILAWIKKHQGATLLITEVLSGLLHGIASPEAVLFNLGGTAINSAFLFAYLPSRDVVSLVLAKIRRAA